MVTEVPYGVATASVRSLLEHGVRESILTPLCEKVAELHLRFHRALPRRLLEVLDRAPSEVSRLAWSQPRHLLGVQEARVVLRGFNARMRGQQEVHERSLGTAGVVRGEGAGQQGTHERPCLRRVLQKELRGGAALANAEAAQRHAPDLQLRLWLREFRGH